jgi:flagellar motor protein MotB
MRGLFRRRTHEDEEESVFVTMTDMTISFLLIVMILLAFFATQISSQDTVPRERFNAILTDFQEALTAIKDLEAELDAAIEERDLAIKERDEAVAERDRAIKERDQLEKKNADLRKRIRDLEEQVGRLQRSLAAMTAERDSAITQRDEAVAARDRAIKERDQLEKKNADQLKQIQRLQEQVGRLQRELDNTKRDLVAVTEERDELRAELDRIKQANPLEAYLGDAIKQREKILIKLRERLLIEFPDLQVVISPEQDALRFQGEGLFPSGVWELGTQQLRVVQTMGRLLDEILVCYTLGDRALRSAECDSGNALIETVQIEGHTDTDRGRIDNIELSTRRASATFYAIRNAFPMILAHENLRMQPVMSVSGYGEMRPIETNETVEGKAANRRIDLRIIMYAPSTEQEVEEIGRRLDALRAVGGAK